MIDAPSIPFAAVVFDLDGTLANSHELVALTVNRVLHRRGYPLIEAREVHGMTGLPIESIFQAVLPAADVEHTLSCVDEYRDLFDRDVLPAIEPIPGAPEAVRIVASGGWPLAVATGRLTRTAELMVRAMGMARHFGAVVGIDVVPRPKPYPDVLIEALARIGGIAPRETLVVGDSAADVAMARAAGARVCAVTWGAQTRADLLSAQPTWCIDRWEELYRLLELTPSAAPPDTP